MGHRQTRTAKPMPESDAKLMLGHLVANRSPLNWIIELMMRTGCRTEEVCHMTMEGFDGDRGAVHIPAAKGGISRWLPVSREFIARGKEFERMGVLPVDSPVLAYFWPESSKASWKRYIREHWYRVQREVFGEVRYCA